MNILKIEQDLNDLQVYAELEGSELGELCRALIAIQGVVSYASDNFQKAFRNEVKNHLQWFKENTRIIEHTETITNTYKELDQISY